jgi:hypothetical protein
VYYADKTLELYTFPGITIDQTATIYNETTGEQVSKRVMGGYTKADIKDSSGKKRTINVGRAVASSFLGKPLDGGYTADHIKNKETVNDALSNIRWANKQTQGKNRTMPENCKSAFLIVKDGVEKTANEWAKEEGVTPQAIFYRAVSGTKEFTYKKYEDLPNEVWKDVEGSRTPNGYWQISNMCRIKYITKYADNVISGDRLCIPRRGGYPIARIKGKTILLHILAFKTFFPVEYEKKTDDMMVLHKNDIKTDFRPENLELGTRSENGLQAHRNGRYDHTLSAGKKCVSIDTGGIEKEHASLCDAARYLNDIGYTSARGPTISNAIRKTEAKGKAHIIYDHAWRWA